MSSLRAILLILVVLIAPLDSANAKKPGEYEVKAAFILSFTRFTQWPSTALPDSAEALVIAIAGKDPFGEVLDATVAGRRVHGRPLMVRRIEGGDALADCHVLFFGRMDPGRRRALLKSVSGRPLLTIGGAEGFCNDGGVINFVMRRSKVRFQISPAAAGKAHLRLSSKLMRLSELVGGARHGRPDLDKK